MARDIKDELQTESSLKNQEQANNTMPMSPLEVSITSDQETELIDIVLQDYDSAKLARNQISYTTDEYGKSLTWEEKYETLLKLYEGYRSPKAIPWKNCSNRTLKIAMAIVEMLHAKLFPSVWNEEIIRWNPGEITDVDKTKRITKLMAWWVMVKTKMRDFVDDWVKECIALGDVVSKTTWQVKIKDKGEMIETPVTDQTGNIVNITKEKKLSIDEMTYTEIRPRDRIYIQPGQTDLHGDEPVIDRISYTYNKLERLAKQGALRNVTDKLKTYVDSRLISNIDRTLQDAEALSIANVQRRNYPIDLIEWYGLYDIDKDGIEEDIIVVVCPDAKTLHSVKMLYSASKRCIRPFEKTEYIRRVGKYHGIGALEQVLPLAQEIDACFNQMTDANTLSIMKPGFYDPGGEIDAPSLNISPNKLTPVSNPQQSLYYPDFNIPTERLILAIRLVLEFIERLTAASSYVMGKESEIVGGSGTATRTNAIMMSAQERFAIPVRRLREGMCDILTQVLDKIQKNIPPGLETRILGEKGEPLFNNNELTQEGISGEFDAYMVGDPVISSKDMEQQLAGSLYSILLQNPLIITDPIKIYKVTYDLLTAYKSEEEAESILGPAPETKDTDTPQEENTLMVQGEFNKVRALLSENHIWHIQEHMALQSSPTLEYLQANTRTLANQVLSYNQQHILEHQQMMQQMMQLLTRSKGGGMSGSPQTNMGGEGGNSGTDSQNAGQSRMANVSEPLNTTLNEKRTGESKLY